MYKLSVILFIILSSVACKPDDEPCDGKARDIIYDLDADDSAHIPMLNIYYQTYIRTKNNVKDTLRFTQISSDKISEVKRIDDEGECPTVFWNNKLTITYADTNKNVTVQHIVVADTEGKPTYTYKHNNNLSFSTQFYPTMLIDTFDIEGMKFYDVVTLYTQDVPGLIYYNDTYGIIRVAKISGEVWQLLP